MTAAVAGSTAHAAKNSVEPWVSEGNGSVPLPSSVSFGQIVKSARDILTEKVGLTFLHMGSPHT